jgi:hypothetical protein
VTLARARTRTPKRAAGARLLLLAVGGILSFAAEHAGAEPTANDIAAPSSAALITAVPPPSLRLAARDDETTRLFKLLGKNASWRPVRTVKMGWSTYHTQGLVKVGDVFFVSAVEVLESRSSNGAETDALYDFSIDRSAGRGRGWLFEFDAAGRLLARLELTDGDIYHPGGIDFDGRHLWVPVSEYRPNSRSHIYRVDPQTLRAELVFSETDHIGGIVHNRHGGSLHGVSWGSRRLYTWALDERLEGRTQVSRGSWEPNPESYIDYQDCHSAGVEYMLCGGLSSYPTPLGSIAFGGIDLIDLRQHRLAHQIPVNVFLDEGSGPNPGLALTHNAYWLEPTGNGSLRVYAMTETDNQADLQIYEATPWMNR